MKKTLTSLISVFLVLLMLLGTACTNSENAEETDSSSLSETESTTAERTDTSDTESEKNSEAESESETETDEPQVEYTDLSVNFSPLPVINNNAKAKASSEGSLTSGDIVLSFDGYEANFKLTPFGLSGLHDAYSCENCKYEEKNSSTALHFCDDSGDHTGVILMLDTPIKASLVSGIKVTYMTADEIKNVSQIRILNPNATNASEIVNHSGCPDISGATEDWKTVDFGMNSSHITSLADTDGYIRTLKFYFRDKDNTELFIKSFTFSTDLKNLCKIEALDGTYYGRGDALDAVAQRIATNLTELGIGAEIELRCSSYVKNTSSDHGSLTYTAYVTPSSGSKITYSSITTVIKKLEGIWLPITEEYGVQKNSNDQYKSGFDRSGILCLEDNILKAAEKLTTVEYAVIAKDADVTDKEIAWFAPQLLELSSDGIDKLFINAFLDYGHRLIEGNEYRLVVRGITENENYILHLDIPFTYIPLSKEAMEAIENATLSMMHVGEMFITEEGDKIAMIKDGIERTVNNGSITVSIRPVAEGVNGGIFDYYFSYKENVSSSRFPAYSLDGVARSDFYAYDSSFYSSRIFVNYDNLPAMDIDLVAPYDGQEDLRIASDEIVRFWDTDVDILITPLYSYGTGELCDPKPVRLEWSSKVSGAFTVKVSEHEDLRDAWTLVTVEEYIDVYNLKAGTRYYWRVENGETVSKTYTFVTEEGYPRYILSDKVSNFRDIGGHITLDGKKVKQGLAFRFSNFDSVSEADKIFINGCLGIRTELDLRGERSSSALGSHVTAIPVSIKWYSGIFAEGESEPLRKAIAVFADEANYPIGYHCAIGRDRTGTVTILILGLLGVDQDTILKEYMVSKLSVSGNGDSASAQGLYNNYLSLIKGLEKFGDPDDSFKNKVEAYLLSIGITEEEIASIRSNLLED